MRDLLESTRHALSTVLIVEDHDKVRANLYDWLNATFTGNRFLEAKSGEEALELAGAQRPNIVLMDIELPGINGIEATRRLKALLPQTQVVILSIHEEDRYRTDATAAGASAYVCKCRMNRDLLPTLSRLLGRPADRDCAAPLA